MRYLQWWIFCARVQKTQILNHCSHELKIGWCLSIGCLFNVFGLVTQCRQHDLWWKEMNLFIIHSLSLLIQFSFQSTAKLMPYFSLYFHSKKCNRRIIKPMASKIHWIQFNSWFSFHFSFDLDLKKYKKLRRKKRHTVSNIRLLGAWIHFHDSNTELVVCVFERERNIISSHENFLRKTI